MRALLVAFLVSLFFLQFVSVISASDGYQSKVSILAQDSVHEGDYFAFGEVVEILGTVNGDVYAAGGDVRVKGKVNGDLLAVGGAVDVSGEITQDVRVAGGQINVDAIIGRNLTIGGGNVVIGEGSNLSGNLVVGSGNLTIEASVPADVTVGAGSATFYETVGGSVTAAVQELRFSDSSSVQGNLTYWSSVEAQGTERVQGEVVMHEVEQINQKQKDQSKQGVAVGQGLFVFLSNTLVGLVLLLVYRKKTSETSDVVKTKPLMSFVYGFAALFAVPLFSILLMLTVVGIPLGLITLFLYLVSLYIAKLFVSLLAGRLIFKRFDIDKSDHWALIVGVLFYAILGLIPLVGFWIKFFATVVGLGAIVISLRTNLGKN